MVPTGGVEPPQLTLPPPQDGVSTNFTTSANVLQALNNNYILSLVNGTSLHHYSSLNFQSFLKYSLFWNNR